jgi:hypothetical protein
VREAKLISSKHFPFYGIFGLAMIILSEVMLFLGVKIVGIYFTPLVWSGYILYIDALNMRWKGTSLIISHSTELLVMLPWSVACWLIFEGYNLYLQNWTYIGLPENVWLRGFGYAWSFATIFPAILETAQLFETILPKKQWLPVVISGKLCTGMLVTGLMCLILPFLVPRETSPSLFAVVWVGFYFLLDPINFILKGNSILREIQNGTSSKIISLVLSGIVCGVLWEFWNYWATAKWQYAVPITFVGPKIFEMPLLGYLGFIPFAFECYAMHQLLMTMINSCFKSRTRLSQV